MLGNLPVAALTNGGLDDNTTLNPVVRGAILGLPVRVVACLQRESTGFRKSQKPQIRD